MENDLTSFNGLVPNSKRRLPDGHWLLVADAATLSKYFVDDRCLTLASIKIGHLRLALRGEREVPAADIAAGAVCMPIISGSHGRLVVTEFLASAKAIANLDLPDDSLVPALRATTVNRFV